MEDNEKNKKEPTTPENTDEGVQQKTISELDRADQIAERQKRENDRREDLLKREEALAARRAIGGGTEAGGETPKLPEMTDKEYAEKALSGKLDVKK